MKTVFVSKLLTNINVVW